jgi:hypothetical protein
VLFPSKNMKPPVKSSVLPISPAISFAVPAVVPVMEVHRTRTVDVDGRGVSAALVKEIHNALAGDGESGRAGVAHIVKIRYPGGGGGGDRCAASAARVEKIRYPGRSDRGIAGAAPFVEFYQPTASDNGVACRGRAALELAAVVK